MSHQRRLCPHCASPQLRAARARDVRAYFNDHPLIRALRA